MTDAPMVDKVKSVKNNLFSWNKAEFGRIDYQIAAFEDKIHGISTATNDRNLSEEEVSIRKSTQIEFWS